jgi:hypothetical protein
MLWLLVFCLVCVLAVIIIASIVRGKCKWSKWGLCDQTCGPGLKTRNFCDKKTESMPCTGHGMLSMEWSPCDESCGTGQKSRTRVAERGTCENQLVQRMSSNRLVSEWSGWSECSETCGTGQKSRYGGTSNRLVSEWSGWSVKRNAW